MARGGKPKPRLRAERGSRVKPCFTQNSGNNSETPRGKVFDLLIDLLCDPQVARAILKSMQRKAAREYADAQDLLDRMPK